MSLHFDQIETWRPDLGKPRIWSHGAKDESIRLLPWPLALAKDVAVEARLIPTIADNVLVLAARP